MTPGINTPTLCAAYPKPKGVIPADFKVHLGFLLLFFAADSH